MLETGKIARQADGAVVATYGETSVLATVVSAKEPKPGIDFFPLTVNYQEHTYAAGRIPGGYFKREGRPTEKETLVSRLIDRPIRPLFVEGYKNETQVVVTVLSHDLENDPDIVAMVAASAALTLSGVPFMGPIGAARVGYIDGQYKLNPPLHEMEESTLDLVVAGTADAVLMVESEAKELAEDVMLGAVMFGHKHFQPVIEAIIRLAEKAAKEPRDFQPADDRRGRDRPCSRSPRTDLRAAYKITSKQERYAAVDAVKAKVMAALCPAEGEAEVQPPRRSRRSSRKPRPRSCAGTSSTPARRIDGRDLTTVRQIVSEVGVLPRTHGSALFTRGETQALVVATLGTGEDEQYIDALEGTHKETFLLHYNFPPYSVGETGRMGSPGRREIGHGKLAWRAIRPMLPPAHEFPYTIRVVSEITESNGSSSMATVCGASLALMDAGVPLRRPVAGIAMGLILEGERFAVLSDILGDEDHLGDMDFKVAGTDERHHLAADGHQDRRHHRGDHAASRSTRRRTAASTSSARWTRRSPRRAPSSASMRPRIETMKIPTDKIREVIGTGGKVIREIVEKTGAKINIDDDGTIKIASADGKSIEAAINWIQSIVAEPEPGMIYDGTVVKIMEFGAFVNFFGAKDGLVHISELAAAPRRQGHRRRQGRRQGQGQVPRHGRARQDPPVDEGRRPGDRRGHHREAQGRARRREEPAGGGRVTRPFLLDPGIGAR